MCVYLFIVCNAFSSDNAHTHTHAHITPKNKRIRCTRAADAINQQKERHFHSNVYMLVVVDDVVRIQQKFAVAMLQLKNEHA